MNIDDVVLYIAQSPQSPEHVRNTVLLATADSPVGNALFVTLSFLTDCFWLSDGPVNEIGHEVIRVIHRSQNQEELDTLLLKIEEKLPQDEFGFPNYLDEETAAQWMERIHNETPQGPMILKEISG